MVSELRKRDSSNFANKHTPPARGRVIIMKQSWIRDRILDLKTVRKSDGWA